MMSESMSITEKENLLFERWKNERKGFVSDGIVDEASYNASKLKIVFILKEVNDPDGGDWDLRKFIREDNRRPRTWDNVTRWVYGIRNLDREINWSEISEITEHQRKDLLRSICAINLKKSPGGHTSNNSDLWKIAVEKDKDYLNEQLSLYDDADFIICCGSITEWIICSIIGFLRDPEWRITSRGIRFHEYKNSKFVISFSHPEARVQSSFLYYGLIDAIKEILSGND